MQPAVSVIIPLYNTEAYVEEALRSVMGQTLRRTEIIVVDDGSNDGSAAVVEALAAEDPRIRLIRQANAGQAAARNTALDVARGAYVYFMDSDDWIEPDTLAACYEKCRSEELDFVFFDAVSFGGAKPSEPWYDYHRAARFEDRIYTGAELMERMLADKSYRCSVCLNLVSRELLDRASLRFHAGIIHEDELFTAILYLQARRVGRIDREFFHRRVREHSTMTSRFSPRNAEGYMTVLAELDRYARSRGPEIRRLAGLLTAYILNPVLRNAWALPAALRWRMAWTVLLRYPRRVRPASLATLLLKSPLLKLRAKARPNTTEP